MERELTEELLRNLTNEMHQHFRGFILEVPSLNELQRVVRDEWDKNIIVIGEIRYGYDYFDDNSPMFIIPLGNSNFIGANYQTDRWDYWNTQNAEYYEDWGD